MNAQQGGGMGGAMAGMGNQVSQYWQRHIADSFWLRIFINLLAALAILFQSLVILGCVPGAPGSSSAASRYYLLEFNAANGTATTRLRIGYTAMCVSLSDQSEHCAITVGKDDQTSIRYLSTGQNDRDSFALLTNNEKVNSVLYDIASGLQSDVFVVMPAIPGAFLAIGVLLLIAYSTLNRPWVGPASSWRQSQRNRRLDIMRILMIACLGLAIVFSFAIAVANSQLFAAMAKVTSHNQQSADVFNVNRGTTALALHWLTVIVTIGFFIGVIQTHVNISSIKVKVTPEDTAGTTGGRQFAAAGDTIEKSSLLRDAEPMAINPAGLTPQAPSGGAGGAGGAMGARGGMRGGARGGAMGARGGAMGARGGAMGARGGAMGRGRGM